MRRLTSAGRCSPVGGFKVVWSERSDPRWSSDEIMVVLVFVPQMVDGAAEVFDILADELEVSSLDKMKVLHSTSEC